MERSNDERVLTPPAYDCNHFKECNCTDEGLESDWEWEDYFGYWMCKGCGEIQ
jgi:hypothetical protein